MAGNSAKKGQEARVMEKVAQMIGERDESIRQAFSGIQQQTGQAFGNMEFRLNLLYHLMKDIGITEEQLNNAAEEVKKVMQQAQQQQQEAAEAEKAQGGEPNVPYGEESATTVVGDTEQQKDSGEGGSEHFGTD